MRERFRDGLGDPALDWSVVRSGALPTYEFEINHWTEEDTDQRRNITRTAPTSGVGFVRQQGESAPQTMKYAGTIMTTTQYNAMQSYYLACSLRTVFFRDYLGTEYEVLVTTFATLKQAVLGQNRDPALKHIWKYRLEMEVIG